MVMEIVAMVKNLEAATPIRIRKYFLRSNRIDFGCKRPHLRVEMLDETRLNPMESNLQRANLQALCSPQPPAGLPISQAKPAWSMRDLALANQSPEMTTLLECDS